LTFSGDELKPLKWFSWRSDWIEYKVQVKREKFPVSMEAADCAGLK
jgi:hypothetical protein